ncbi:TonB-dependent receptor [Marinilabiliaceae bacterium ANBcel2]|nr:TonB-dependent receptor [Marinilabiliaceae bacterium ANBcel2]
MIRGLLIAIVLTLTLHASSQTVIRGIVINEFKEPVPGANVILNGGASGTVADHNGEFSFKDIPKDTHEIKASSLGYEMYADVIEADKEEVELTIEMKSSDYELAEVNVVRTRQNLARITNSQPVQHIPNDFIRDNMAGSLMQTLSSVPGVSSMDIGSGISKPVIRGMGYYRVVVAQNGIKHEGQQWNSHHGISVDQHSINNLEVIKGPASLKFGSDAIGGVINILPPDIPKEDGISGRFSVTGKSNNEWIGGNASLSGKNGDFYMHANITHNRFGDFKIPDTDYFVEPAPVSASEASHRVSIDDYVSNTAGEENALSFIGGVEKSWGESYIELSYHKSENGFFDWEGMNVEKIRKEHEESRHDINDPKQSIENYSINSNSKIDIGNNRLEIGLGYQYNLSQENSRLMDRTGNRKDDLEYYRSKDNLELELALHNLSANVTYSLRSINNHIFDFVINSQYHNHKHEGYSHILPDYNRLSTGVGIIHRYHLNDEWRINSGVRFDFHNFEMDEALNPDPDYGEAVFNPQFSKNFNGSSFALGANYTPHSNLLLRANIGKSYRVPSAYELGAYGLHRHEGRFERGDLNNKPEVAWQIDLGAEKRFNRLEVMVSPFANYFTRYLYLQPTAILRAEGQVYEYRQSEALLYGGEFMIDFDYSDNLNFQTGGEYVYALNLDNNSSLPFTPPFSILSQLTWMFNNSGEMFSNSRLSFEARKAAKQNQTVPNELDTPGYVSFNFTAQTDLNVGENKLNMLFRVNNIFDNRYYNHISFYRRLRIPEPGRDIELTVSYSF